MQSYPVQHVCPVVFSPQYVFLHKQTYLFLELTDALCSFLTVIPYTIVWLHCATRINLMQLLLSVEHQCNTILIHIYSKYTLYFCICAWLQEFTYILQENTCHIQYRSEHCTNTKWKSFAEQNLEEGSRTICHPHCRHCLPLLYAPVTMQGLHFNLLADPLLASWLQQLSFPLPQTHSFFLIPCSWEEH